MHKILQNLFDDFRPYRVLVAQASFRETSVPILIPMSITSSTSSSLFLSRSQQSKILRRRAISDSGSVCVQNFMNSSTQLFHFCSHQTSRKEAQPTIDRIAYSPPRTIYRTYSHASHARENNAGTVCPSGTNAPELQDVCQQNLHFANFFMR